VALPEERQEFVADTRRYSGPLRDAARDADKFRDRNEAAALAARRMGLAAKEAADKASRAQREAADAAEKLAKGEIGAAEAADKAARAERELERASIKAAEAQRATADAADKAAANYRQMGRAAELAAAKQRLAALRSAGAVREHNTELLKLRRQFPDLAKDASGAFKLMETGGQRFGNAIDGALKNVSVLGKSGPLVLAGIVGILENLPALAAAAGGGITIGLGGALAAIGIMSAAKNEEVKRSFTDMRKHVSLEAQIVSFAWQKTLKDIAADGKTAFDALAPSLQSAFDEMSPAVDRFAFSFASSMHELDPAIQSIGHAFSNVLDDLGPRMPAIMNNIATGVKAITDAAAANPGAINALVEDVSKLVRYTGDSIGILIRYGSQIKSIGKDVLLLGPGLGSLISSVGKVKGAFTGAKDGLDIVDRTFPSFSQQATVAAASTQHLMTAQQAAALTSQQLKSALDALTGAFQSGFDAETQYRVALLAATAQAKANNAGITKNTAAANTNRQSLSQLAAAIKDVELKTHPTAAVIATMRARLIASAQAMGVSHRAAIALAQKLLGVKSAADKIPAQKSTKLNDNTPSARARLQAYQHAINALHGKHIDIYQTMHLTTVQAYQNQRQAISGYRPKAHGGPMDRGPIKHLADGGPSGLVSGPGTSTSDSILAALSTGEFVVNANATEKNTAALAALNSGMSWMQAAMVTGERFAKGGRFHPHGKQVNLPRPPTKAALAKLAHAKHRPEELAALAAQSSLASMRSSALGAMRVAGLVGAGSGHGATVMHVTNVNVTVQGSIRSDRDIVDMVQQKLLQGRKAVGLQAGR